MSDKQLAHSWTAAILDKVQKKLPWSEVLPTRQPYYVGSWVYIFGVICLAALFWVITSGIILILFGPSWWHISSTGRFLNSTHFWSVQLFFIFMVLHMWGQYWGAGWRHGRAKTWMIGVVIFAFSIVTAFTGYLAQQNFAAQWVGVNAKDAINSTGAGAVFNPLNFGQMLSLHILLFPLLLCTLVGLHIVQVRMKGVVKPLGEPEIEGQA